MSGSLIVPSEIPGTDVVPEQIAASATSYRTTATAISEKSTAVVSSWSGLSGVYSAPEAPQLLASMDPVGTDSRLIADKLTRVAGLLETLAEVSIAPVRRLKELKQEAEDFVASVAGGVTVDYYDPDNTLNQANAMNGAYVYMPEGQGEQTLPWDQHTPSVNRNNELLEQVNAEVLKLLDANAECTNGINALRDDVCVVPVEVPTLDQLNAAEDLPWGQIGKGDRSCSESVGDGLFEFGKSFVGGVVALGGWDIDNNWEHSGDTAQSAWGGLLSGLGALAITAGNPAAPMLAYAPDEMIPDWMEGGRDWYRGTLEAMVGGIVGTPGQWREDPLAAGTYAFASIATFFLPGLGQAGAGAKVAGALARAGLATERLATVAGEGTRLANGLARSGEVFSRLSETVRTISGADPIRHLDESLAALDDIGDAVPDNLIPRAESGAADVPAGSTRLGENSASVGGGHSGGGTAVLERPVDTVPDRGTGGGATGGQDGTGGGSDGSSGSTSGGGSESPRTPDGSDGAPDGSGSWDDVPSDLRDEMTGDAGDTGDGTTGDPSDGSGDAGADAGGADASPPPTREERIADAMHRYPDISESQAARAVRYEELIGSGRYPDYVNGLFEGSIFDVVNEQRYEANQISLDVADPAGVADPKRTRLDSYNPGDAVVSRKETQLAQHPEQAISSLRELIAKYKPDDVSITIADTPGNVAKLGQEAIGTSLNGRMVLEVPVQAAPVPRSVLDFAAGKSIIIRDVAGHRYR